MTTFSNAHADGGQRAPISGMPMHVPDDESPAGPLTDAERQAWRVLSESGQLLESILDRRLKDRFDISHADHGVLRRLQDAGDHQFVYADAPP